MSSHRIRLSCSFVVRFLVVLTASSFARADYPHAVISDEPTVYWRLNGPHGSAIAVNSGTSGPEADGLISGGGLDVSGPIELHDGTAILGMGAQNRAYVVSGGTSHISSPTTLLSGVDAFTVSGWIFPNSRQTDRIGLWGQNDVIEFGFVEPNELQLWTAGGGSINWAFDPNDDIVERQWTHVAATGNGESLTLYLDGEQVASGGSSIGDTYGTSDFPFRVGGGGIFDAEGNQFSGRVDDVAVFDRALSADRIQSHFLAALGGADPGDFNSDGAIDLTDVNLLNLAIVNGSDDTVFDVDGNEIINDDDLAFWIGDIVFTWFGDANLDLEFNSGDLVEVFRAGEYEDNELANSRWEEGDWNADLEFDSSDFVAAFGGGGYELGPGARPAAVPEPGGLALCLVGWAIILCRRRTMTRGL